MCSFARYPLPSLPLVSSKLVYIIMCGNLRVWVKICTAHTHTSRPSFCAINWTVFWLLSQRFLLFLMAFCSLFAFLWQQQLSANLNNSLIYGFRISMLALHFTFMNMFWISSVLLLLLWAASESFSINIVFSWGILKWIIANILLNTF